MSAQVGDIHVSAVQAGIGHPELLLDVPVETNALDDESDPVAAASLDRREVEDLRLVCDQFLAGEQVRL